MPADELPAFVKGYVPKLRQDFEKLLEQSRPRPVRPAFVSAELRATLENDTLKHGTGVLQRFPWSQMQDRAIESGPGNSGSRQTSFREWLPVTSNLAVQRPRWRSDAGDRTAVWGVLDGQTTILADPQASTLQFGWSLRGQRQSDHVRFHLQLPNALMQQVRLTLPSDRMLQADRGMVSRQDHEEKSVWTINLGGYHDVNLTITDDLEDLNLAAKPILKQSTDYRFGPDGIDVVSSLDIEQIDAPITMLRLRGSRGLAVTGVEMDGKPLMWSPLPPPADEGQSFLVEIPQSFFRGGDGARLSLTVNAISHRPGQQNFTLPRVRTEDLTWSAETVRLFVRNPLELVDLNLEDGVCTQILQEPDESSETFEVTLESPFAQLQLKLRQRPAKSAVQAGFLLELGDTSVVANAVVRFHPNQGQLFDLEAELGKGWRIDEDSVDALASLGDGSFATTMDRWEDQDGNLAVRLRKPATFRHPVTLQVQLRRQANLLDDGPLTLDELIPFTLPADPKASIWIAAHAAPTFQMVIDNVGGAEWQRAWQLPPWLSERWALSEADTLLTTNPRRLHTDDPGNVVRLGVRKAIAPIKLVVETDLRLSEGTVHQTSHLKVDPLGSQLETFDLSFSRPLPANSIWRLGNTKETIAAVPLRRTESDVNEETTRYRIRLSTARTEPFEIQVQFDSSEEEQWNVPLATGLNVTSQTGTVVIRGGGGATVRTDQSRGLQPMPVVAIDEDPSDRRDLLSAFRYADTPGQTPSLRVTHISESSHPACWAWRCDLRSYFVRQGRPRHRVDYYLQNEGARTFEVELPEGYELDAEQVEVNSTAVDPINIVQNLWSIPLPSRQRYPCVTIRYLDEEQTLSAIDWLAPPIPDTNTVELQRTWQAWLPPGFQVYGIRQGMVAEDYWAARLFGPLARDTNQQPFRSPFSLLAGNLFSGNDPTETLVQLFLTVPADATSEDTSVEVTSPTWGERLVRINKAIARTRPDFELLIDRVELRRLGVFAHSRLPPSRREFRREVTVDHLTKAGLGLLVQDDRLVLTSLHEVRRNGSEPNLIEGIAATLKREWRTSPRFQSAAEWSLGPSQPLWQSRSDEIETRLRQAGWVSHRQAINDPPSSLKVYQQDTITACVCATFLLATVAGWQILKRRQRAWFVVLTLSAVLSLILPQPASLLAMTLMWGTLASGLLRMIMKRSLDARPRQGQFRVAMAPTKATAGLLLAAGLLDVSDQPAWSQELRPTEVNSGVVGYEPTPTTLAESDQATIFPLYAPSERSSEAQADVVYLPPQLYRLLHDTPSSRTEKAYVFTRALYEGALPRRADVLAPKISATLWVSTTVSNAAVSLPDFGPNASFKFDSIRVDRRSHPVTLDRRGHPLVILPNAGDYRVSCDLQPVIESQFGEHSLRLAIPQLPDSSLDLKLPRDVQVASVPSALGDTRIDQQRGSIQAQLGPTADLLVRFTRTDVGFRSAIDIDQLIRLEFSQDQVLLETTFRYNDLRVPLRLKVDRRLQFIPSDEVAKSELLSWDAVKSELLLAAARTGSSATAKFVLPRSNLLGRFFLPELSVADLPVRQRWIAVTSTAGLDVQAAQTDGLDSVSFDQFKETWGEVTSVPDTILLTDPTSKVSLNVRTAADRVDWTSDTSFFFRATETRFLVDGTLTSESSVSGTQRFVVPPPMNVDQVTVTSLGLRRDIRWHSDQQGNLLLFFLEQHDGPIQVHIEGNLPVATPGESIELPRVAPRDAAQQLETIQLYRSPYRDVEPVRTIGLLQIATTETYEDLGEPIPGEDRLIGSWISDATSSDNSTSMEVLVAPLKRTQQRTTGTLVTQLDRDNEGWRALVRTHLESRQGHLDAVHFEVPASLEIEGSATGARLEMRSGPTADKRIIVAWLPPSKEKQRSLEFELRIAVPEQEDVSLPQIRMFDVQLLDHHIFLTTGGGDDNGAGEPADDELSWIPMGLVRLDETKPGYEAFRVDQPEYQAKLRPPAVDRSPQVHLLQTTLAWAPSGHMVGLATFDMRPPGRSSSILQLPSKCDLVQVLIDGNRTGAEELQSNEWRIELGPNPWPQRVQVLYQGPCEVANNGRVRLQAPRLRTEEMPITIAQVVWSVHSNQLAGRGFPRDVVSANNPRDEDMAIVHALNEVFTDAQLIRDNPREHVAAWFSAWAFRSRAALNRLLDPNSTDDNPEQQAIRQLQADQRIQVGGLGMVDVLDHVDESNRDIEQQDSWHETQWYGGQAIRCASGTIPETSLPELTVDYPRFRQQTPTLRYLIAAGIACLALVASSWPVQNIGRWIRNHPHVAGASLGLAWWALLSPAWVGLAVAAAVIAAWLFSKLRQGRTLTLEHAP